MKPGIATDEKEALGIAHRQALTTALREQAKDAAMRESLGKVLGWLGKS